VQEDAEPEWLIGPLGHLVTPVGLNICKKEP
jgi:hypothetical protein